MSSITCALYCSLYAVLLNGICMIILGATNSYTNSEIVTEYVNIMKESLKRIQDVVDHPVHESILQSHLHVALVPSDKIYCVT